MIILEDTRQQERKHERKHEYFRSVGVHWNRTALYCGDYTLPANQSVCVDTKKNIDEIINDIHVKKMKKSDIYEKVISVFEEYHLNFDYAEKYTTQFAMMMRIVSQKKKSMTYALQIMFQSVL